MLRVRREAAITKKAMAERMKTSRAQLDRLLDPASDAVTLDTLTRAAQTRWGET